MDDIAAGVLVGSVNGDIIGGAQLVGGKKGKALNTNGLDQCVDLGNQRDNCMGNLDNCHTTFVMAMWLRMHRYDDLGANNDEYYITSGGHTDRSMGVALLMREKSIRVIFRTASRVWELSYTTEPKLHTWYHVFLSWSNADGGRVYINGMLGGEDRLGTSHVNNLDGNAYNKFLLGCESTFPFSGAGQMTLDNLRIWDVAWPIGEMHPWLQYVTDTLAWCFHREIYIDKKLKDNMEYLRTICINIYIWQQALQNFGEWKGTIAAGDLSWRLYGDKLIWRTMHMKRQLYLHYLWKC